MQKKFLQKLQKLKSKYHYNQPNKSQPTIKVYHQSVKYFHPSKKLHLFHYSSQQETPKGLEKYTLEDLVPCFDSRRPEDDGVGVVGIAGWQSELRDWGESDGESKTASEYLLPTSMDGDESSRVCGTYTQRFNPRASLAFLHLLPICSNPSLDSET